MGREAIFFVRGESNIFFNSALAAKCDAVPTSRSHCWNLGNARWYQADWIALLRVLESCTSAHFCSVNTFRGTAFRWSADSKVRSLKRLGDFKYQIVLATCRKLNTAKTVCRAFTAQPLFQTFFAKFWCPIGFRRARFYVSQFNDGLRFAKYWSYNIVKWAQPTFNHLQK